VYADDGRALRDFVRATLLESPSTDLVAGTRVAGPRNAQGEARHGTVLPGAPKTRGSGRRARVMVYVAWDGDYFIHPQPGNDQREKRWVPVSQLRREE